MKDASKKLTGAAALVFVANIFMMIVGPTSFLVALYAGLPLGLLLSILAIVSSEKEAKESSIAGLNLLMIFLFLVLVCSGYSLVQ